MLNSADEFQAVRDWLDECAQPLVISHRRPDGDALGAVAAFSRGLTALGLAPRAALFEPLPARYALLQDMVTWRRWDLEADALRRECDAVIILDTCAWAQLEPVGEYLRTGPRTLVIDHHPTRDELGTRPGDLRLLDDTAGATCLLIAEWLEAAAIFIEPPVATALLVGLATDTGWFRFSNTDARVLRMAADLVAAGAPPAPVYRFLYEQDPPAKLKLIARLFDQLETLAGGRLAVLRLRQADFIAAGANGALTEDLVNEVGRLGGVEVILLCTEEPDGRVRLNFRSKQHVDVAALAQQFGGGGHTRAAGARVAGAWDEVVPRVVTAALAALDSSSGTR